jgi:hypothetical protein
MSRRRRQELHCHGCNQWVQFLVDLEMDGNHVLHCPVCNHEHCRVVKEGVITDIRWDSRNGPTFGVSRAYTSSSSTQMYFVGASGGTGATTATMMVWSS